MGKKNTVGRNIGGISLVDAFEEYIAEKKRSVRDITMDAYKGSFNKFINFVGDDMLAKDVNKQTISDWVDDMKDNDLKDTSINHYGRAIRTFLYFCFDNEYTSEFVVDVVKVKQEETPKTFTFDEQKALIQKPLKNASFGEYRSWVIVQLILDSGSRSSSIINIRLADVDFHNQVIHLAHTKNGKQHTVPMSSDFERILKNYIREWRTTDKEGNKIPETAYLFSNIANEQMTRNSLKLSFRRYCQNRGVNKSSIHGLRHTFATEYIRNNGQPFRLQRILGHSTLEMTRRYVDSVALDTKGDHDNRSPLKNLKENTSRTQTVHRAS